MSLKFEEKKIEGHGARYYEATLGDFDGGDGVRFSYYLQPSCNVRGRWRLLIEFEDPHHTWGAWDEADQPVRYYHHEGNLLSEAQSIADEIMARSERRL